jgi:hypothetical protein
VWVRGQRWVTVLVSIRPVRPRVVTSNVITPRSSANLVRLPFLVLLELPVVAPHHTEQTLHGPPTSKDRMAIPPMSVYSVFTGGFRYRTRASAQKTTRRRIHAHAGRFGRRLQLGPSLMPPTSWSLSPVAGPSFHGRAESSERQASRGQSHGVAHPSIRIAIMF